MRDVDYDKIWEVYEIPEDQELYHRARQTIRRYWHAYLKTLGKPEKFLWERLTEREQDDFIYNIIHKTMKDNYVPYQAEERVERRINNYNTNSMQTVDDILRTRNEIEDNLYRDHQTATHSDAKKQEAYKGLCNDIQTFNPNIPQPTYEEFVRRLSLNAAVCPEEANYEARVQDMEMVYRNIRVYRESLAYGVARNDEEARAEDRANAEAAIRAEDEEKAKGQPITAYEYVMDYETTMLNPTLNVDGATDIYVRIILKVLEEKLGLKVDYDMIDKCLLCRAEFFEYCKHKDIDVDKYWRREAGYVVSEDGDKPEIIYNKFPIEYDENLGMSMEQHEELKKRYAEYLSCQKKLNELKPLYQYEEKDDSKPR